MTFLTDRDGDAWRLALGLGSGAKAFHSVTQNAPTATEYAVLFNSEEFNSGGFHSTVSNTSRFTVPPGKGGRYLLQGGGLIPNTGSPTVNFRKNGTTYIRGTGGGGVAGNNTVGDGIAELAAGDYVEMIVFQASGGDLTIGHASALQSQMAMAVIYLGE